LTTSTAPHPVDLEPTFVGVRTYATRRRLTRIDAAALLSIMVCLLYCLPATLIVPAMTYAGRPALLIAFVLWCWWLLARLSKRLVMLGPQPIRWVVLFYLLATLLSYLAGTMRGLPQLEANGLDFTLILTLEFLGVVLMAADGIPNWERLLGVMRVFVWSGGFMAIVALLQVTTQVNITEYIRIPGLVFLGDVADFQPRGDGGLFRVAGTATHYIEFSVVMAMTVPFAIHFARFASSKRARAAAATVALLMVAAIPMAISRTGVLALVTAVAVMFIAAWNWRTRFNVMVIGVAVVGGLIVMKPGLLGTIGAMFTSIDEDPSISGRTDDYAIVGHWFAQRPWLGRGPGTLIPDLYLILDNQWLYSLVTGGILGVTAFATLHIAAITLAWIALKRAKTPADKHLCAALISAILISMLVSATFDSLSFTTFSFTLALCCGMSGAVWRFTHPQRAVRTSSVRWLAD
jgi:polysaccharide biosynthesis protein PslJ